VVVVVVVVVALPSGATHACFNLLSRALFRSFVCVVSFHFFSDASKNVCECVFVFV
jgi:hypothetical protein